MHSCLTYLQSVLKEFNIDTNQPLLLACSGGMDSMSLCHLLLDLGYQPALAHVNFKLRGEESDGDQQFVQDFCENHGLKFFTTSFQTEEESRKQGVSIQMAARRLRYEWLFDLKELHGFHRILTAHHDRDQAETVLLNLMRGTGAKGLSGMKVDDGRLLRPLLHLSYPLLADYAKTRKLVYREDSSNASVKYKRNFIRHVLLAPWEEEFPGTIRQINRTTDIMQEVNGFLDEQLKQEVAAFISEDGNTHISFAIRNHPYARLLMRYLLHEAGMSDQAPFVLDSFGRVGALFRSADYELLTDRDHWVLRKNEHRVTTGIKEYKIPMEEQDFAFGKNHFQLRRAQAGETFPKHPNSVWISETLLLSGLVLRNWMSGDKMIPFGMKGKKKLSDLFVDEKINRFDKHELPVLVNAEGEVLWVCGIRGSERLRVDVQETNYWVLCMS